jgi:hypothetical protein
VKSNKPWDYPVKLTALGLLAVLLMYQLVVAVRTGLGDLYAAPAIHYLIELNDSEMEISSADRQAIERSLNRGLVFAPGMPEYLSSLGWLQQERMALGEAVPGDDEWRRLSALAYDSYAKAAVQRPTWPYDWADVALELYRQERFGSPEYHQALVNAARFGPWKNDIQIIVAELALDTWAELAPTARQATLAAIDRGVRRQPGVMLGIIDASPARAAMCSAAVAVTAALPYLRADCLARFQSGRSG